MLDAITPCESSPVVAARQSADTGRATGCGGKGARVRVSTFVKTTDPTHRLPAADPDYRNDGYVPLDETRLRDAPRDPSFPHPLSSCPSW